MLGIIDLAIAFIKAVLSPIVLSNGTKTAVQVTGGGGLPSNFVCSVGAGGGSATIALQQSNDQVNWSAIPLVAGGAQVTFNLTAANANTSQVLTGLRTQQYVQAVVSSVSGTIIAGIDIIEGSVFSAPAGLTSGSQTSYVANG